MYDPFEPTPEDLNELNRMADTLDPNDDPAMLQALARAEEFNRKMEILGKTLFYVEGTRGTYFEPDTDTLWWKSPRGWHETKIVDGPHGRYARLALTIDTIRRLAGLGNTL